MKSKTTVDKVKLVVRWLVGCALIYTGFLTLFVKTTQILTDLDRWLRMDYNSVLTVLGIIEIVLGLALIILKKYRRQIGWATSVFFLIIYLSQHFSQPSLFTFVMHYILHPILIICTLWSTGAWKRTKKLGKTSELA